MCGHYQTARRLAKALGDTASLRDLEYNIAATGLQVGRTQEAYDFFSRAEHPSVMTLHKLAICCEQLGKREEALAALQKAEAAPQAVPEKAFSLQLCALVRFRLEHPDYLRRPEYGAALLSCFDRMRRELPDGYAGFHLPWVIEWHKAARQYKQAYELLLSFPAYSRFIRI